MCGDLRRPLRGALVALVCAALLAPHAASADQRRERKAAEAHKEQGKAYYRVELYDKAIDEFKQAYAFTKEAGLLFNIGRCYEKINDRLNALQYYEEYLKTSPADVTEVNARVELLRRQIEQEKGDYSQRQEETRRRQKANDHVAAATRLLGERQFDAAIVEYSSAYQLTRDAEMVFLTAEAYRGKGDKAQAVFEYRRFADLAPFGS
jgi:tetratricopeptide (TPR) repeat protein